MKNLNDDKKNHPTTDLIVTNPSDEGSYEVSVKAKDGRDWPSVRGIRSKNQYIVFVDVECDGDPEFYVLNQKQWGTVLSKRLPHCDQSQNASIVDGAIEWNWESSDGKSKRRRGATLTKEQISSYKDKWSVLPGVTK